MACYLYLDWFSNSVASLRPSKECRKKFAIYGIELFYVLYISAECIKVSNENAITSVTEIIVVLQNLKDAESWAWVSRRLSHVNNLGMFKTCSVAWSEGTMHYNNFIRIFKQYCHLLYLFVSFPVLVVLSASARWNWLSKLMDFMDVGTI